MPISSKKSLNNLAEEIKTCKKCLDLVKTRKQPVAGSGAPQAKLIIAGYYPTPEGSEQSGIPFSGDEEGAIIKKAIDSVGLSLENDVFLTYMVKCTPRKVSKLINVMKPLEQHVNNCFNYFAEEISIITPHLIISLGISTTKIILDRFFSIEKKVDNMALLHMRLFENPSFKLIPFFSPKAVLAGNITEEKYLEDFKKLSKLFSLI
jgi:uracil-DNA glycosylase family 4